MIDLAKHNLDERDIRALAELPHVDGGGAILMRILAKEGLAVDRRIHSDPRNSDVLKEDVRFLLGKYDGIDMAVQVVEAARIATESLDKK